MMVTIYALLCYRKAGYRICKEVAFVQVALRYRGE
jgi:hypothetical protein